MLRRNQPRPAHTGASQSKSGDALEYWFDASGHDHHVRQSDAKARPTLRLDGGLGAIRFNGRGANFSLNGLGLTAENLTAFLVVAPFRNEGGFRGMVSMHAKGEDDFRSGINVDLGPYGSAKFDVVNVEGAGTAGAQNLRVHDNPFAQFRRLCVATSPGSAKCRAVRRRPSGRHADSV